MEVCGGMMSPVPKVTPELPTAMLLLESRFVTFIDRRFSRAAASWTADPVEVVWLVALSLAPALLIASPPFETAVTSTGFPFASVAHSGRMIGSKKSRIALHTMEVIGMAQGDY